MAKKYDLTTAFTAITETSGTIQNVGSEAVELTSSTNAVEGEGIVLNPSEKRSFKGAMSARSLGDAGAVVNVVDFTEAGEGGEEYDLPIASDTTLGGIKISNSFTVANDGTLSIKKSGKTILGAVKSSDDEGKVSVNNDGTMTYNPLGYRQPSTAYTAGQIAYHASLPTGRYLECTTAGTSGSGDLTISSPIIGGTVTDGTVVWTINKDLSLFGGFMYAALIGRNVNTSNLRLIGALDTNSGAGLTLYGSDWGDSSDGAFDLKAIKGSNSCNLKGLPNSNLTWGINDLGGSAIVAKSIGINGYIKYASGLIIQWGQSGKTTWTFPITFTAIPCVVATPQGGNQYIYVDNVTESSVTIMTSPNSDWGKHYIAIGY